MPKESDVKILSSTELSMFTTDLSQPTNTTPAMRYSYDDQHNFMTKKCSGESIHKLTDVSAVDYFQFDFNEVQYHNCWKLIQHSHSSSPLIPQSTNIARLENIIWRKWAKAKAKLQECKPEEVNWYKDCDITWLYGPLADSKRSESILGLTANSCENVSLSSSDKRNDSFSSLSSVSTIDSLGFDQGSDNDSIQDTAVLSDDEYELFSVKSILKRTGSSPLQLEEFRNLGLEKTNKSELSAHLNKTVSFAEMVQIRQFY